MDPRAKQQPPRIKEHLWMVRCRTRVAPVYLPKREELLLRDVRALPNASSRGCDAASRRSTCHQPRVGVGGGGLGARETSSAADLAPLRAMYRKMYLHVSVFPAPLSPLTIIDWSRWVPGREEMHGKRRTLQGPLGSLGHSIDMWWGCGKRRCGVLS